MAAPSATALQQLMRDLQKRQQALSEQMQTYQQLQTEVASLQQRAPHDAQARQRLGKLSRAMQGELAPLQQQLSSCMSHLQDHFQSLEATLKPVGNGEATKAAPAANNAKLSRTYL